MDTSEHHVTTSQALEHKIAIERQAATPQQSNIAIASAALRGQFSAAWKLWQDTGALLSDAERTAVEEILNAVQICLSQCNEHIGVAISSPTTSAQDLIAMITAAEQRVASALILLRSYIPFQLPEKDGTTVASSPPPAYSLAQQSAVATSVQELSGEESQLARAISDPGTTYAELPGDASVMPSRLQWRRNTAAVQGLAELEAGYIAYRRSYASRQAGMIDRQVHISGPSRPLHQDELHFTSELTARPVNPPLPRPSTSSDTGQQTVLTGRARSRRWLEVQASRSRG